MCLTGLSETHTILSHSLPFVKWLSNPDLPSPTLALLRHISKLLLMKHQTYGQFASAPPHHSCPYRCIVAARGWIPFLRQIYKKHRFGVDYKVVDYFFITTNLSPCIETKAMHTKIDLVSLTMWFEILWFYPSPFLKAKFYAYPMTVLDIMSFSQSLQHFAKVDKTWVHDYRCQQTISTCFWGQGFGWREGVVSPSVVHSALVLPWGHWPALPVCLGSWCPSAWSRLATAHSCLGSE